MLRRSLGECGFHCNPRPWSDLDSMRMLRFLCGARCVHVVCADGWSSLDSILGDTEGSGATVVVLDFRKKRRMGSRILEVERMKMN